MNIIGITGKAGSGKDTVADILVREHGFVKVALADPMKRICRDVFQFTDQQLWGPSEFRNAPDRRYPREHAFHHVVKGAIHCACCGVPFPEAGQCYLTPRFALQRLGTEYGRAMHQDVWINKALSTAKWLCSGVEKNSYPPLRPAYDAPTGTTWRQAGVYGQPETYFHPKGVVISDVRFDNELVGIRREGGRIWHRPGEGSLKETPAAAHASETAKLDCDAQIPWLDDVAQLPDIVKRLLEAK
jgi:hypothetical protein